MKNNYLLSAFFLLTSLVAIQAQTDIYAQGINHTNLSLRGGVITLGTINTSFPTDGYVVVHFDGECYVSVGDRVLLAASNNGNIDSNDGHVEIESSKAGFGRPFSHTRVYQVTAGNYTYSALGQNSIELDGTGIASVYGTLSVEYFPNTGPAIVKSTGFIFDGDVTNTTVVAQQTIHATGQGKILVRFDGFINSAPGDRIVLAASNTMNWSFNDGNVAVEAVNEGDVIENSFSHTRVYSVPSAGDYTYYAVSQNYGETGGNAMISVFGNLLTEYFPNSGPEKLLFQGFTLPEIDLNGQPITFVSISVDAPEAGKVMVVLDGYLTANQGYDIVLAASNGSNWAVNDGNVTLQALDNDQNRYSFSHTRVYNVSAGNNTLNGVGQIFGGSGSETADLFGELTVKYIPSSATATNELSKIENTFELDPNPTNDVVHILSKNPLAQKMKIQLLDLNGRVLKEFQKNTGEEINIDLSSFPSNLYWIKIGNQTKPVVRM